MNDPAVLRKKIAELESENRRLKEESSQPKSYGTMGKPGAIDNNWMNFGSNPLDRPTTANTSN